MELRSVREKRKGQREDKPALLICSLRPPHARARTESACGVLSLTRLPLCLLSLFRRVFVCAGVVMFVMLFGYPPFHADSDQEIFRQVLEGFTPIVKKGYKAHFPLAINCSDSAKDLISKLLTSDTAKRLTADEALAHPWLTGESSSSAPMVLDVLTNLKNFSAHSKFKQGILNLMVNTLSEADLNKLKKLFQEIDADGNGHITVAELTAAVEKSGSLAVQGIAGGAPANGSKLTAADLKRILEAADMDGDGTLSYHELVLTTVQRKLSAKEERLWLAFSKIDLNRDGMLTIEELSSVLGEDINSAASMIKSVDKDGNGSIDFDEFLDLWLKVRGRRTRILTAHALLDRATTADAAAESESCNRHTDSCR